MQNYILIGICGLLSGFVVEKMIESTNKKNINKDDSSININIDALLQKKCTSSKKEASIENPHCLENNNDNISQNNIDFDINLNNHQNDLISSEINKDLMLDNDIVLIKTQINQSIKDINRLENDNEFNANNKKNNKKLNKLYNVLNNLYKLLEEVSSLEKLSSNKQNDNNNQNDNSIDKNNQKVIVNINHNKRRYKLKKNIKH